MPTPAAPSTDARPRQNLALAFQELLTVATRLHSGRQAVHDEEGFRLQLRRLLAAAQQDALRSGYEMEDTRQATDAVLALLRGALVRRCGREAQTWLPAAGRAAEASGPGSSFFRDLREAMKKPDTHQAADLLEVYLLCLLLGFEGEPGEINRGELAVVVSAVGERIRRIRLLAVDWSPGWHPGGSAAPQSKPRLSRLAMTPSAEPVA